MNCEEYVVNKLKESEKLVSELNTRHYEVLKKNCELKDAVKFLLSLVEVREEENFYILECKIFSKDNEEEKEIYDILKELREKYAGEDDGEEVK